MKKIVILTGAGISAESGIKTFRDHDGLWENHDIMEVASIEGWHRNPALVLDFYNQRRKQAASVTPNPAHLFLAALEHKYHVTIITQNVDDLHEKAGSSNVLHLHGRLSQAKSMAHTHEIIELKDADIKLGDLCSQGHQLRPNIVWFGEAVPMLESAENICKTADIFVIIGTRLQVYPAAGLIYRIPENTPVFIIDPKVEEIETPAHFTCIQTSAVKGVQVLEKHLAHLEYNK